MPIIKAFLFPLLLFNLSVAAQEPDITNYNPVSFDVIKYKGNIGKFPVTMLLTFYPDNKISGYYYYNHVGQLIRIEKQENELVPFAFRARPLEIIDNNSANQETFEFPDSVLKNKNIIKAKWKYRQKSYPVTLIRDSSMFDWRLLRQKSVGYYKNSYFKTQTTDFSIIYPTVSSSPVLNKKFLGNNIKDKQMIAFINSTKSNYLLIDQNYGENTDEDEDCCWSQEGINELAYISDSILTYRSRNFIYANNGYETESYISLKTSNGELLTTSNIFKNNSIDTVLTILRNKYEVILQQKETDPNTPSDGNDAPFRDNYTKDTNVFLTKGGLYFRERLFKLGQYYDLFLSYKEINNYLNDSFKRLIGP